MFVLSETVLLLEGRLCKWALLGKWPVLRNVGQMPIYRFTVDSERPRDLSLGHPCRK